MRIIPAFVLAGVGSLAFAGAVAAQSLPAHVTTIRLPDGSLEQIRYAGNVAPQVTFLQDQASPFALLNQISYEMDREMAAAMQGLVPISTMPFPGPGLLQIDTSRLPPGTESYQFVESLSPGGVCSQSMEITSAGPGVRPRVVTHTSGNCGPQETAGPMFTAPYAVPSGAPSRILSVKADHQQPQQPRLLREASLQ